MTTKSEASNATAEDEALDKNAPNGCRRTIHPS